MRRRPRGEADRVLADAASAAGTRRGDRLEDRLGHVLRLGRVAEAGGEHLAVAPHDRLVRRGLVVARRLGRVLEDAGHDHAGLDVHHADAEAPHLVRERLARALERPLRGRVGDLVRGRDQARDRGDVHDRAASAARASPAARPGCSGSRRSSWSRTSAGARPRASARAASRRRCRRCSPARRPGPARATAAKARAIESRPR